MDSLRVSVILPVYNEAAGIAPLLKALKAHLAGRCEILFVDGGSADGTVQIIEAAGFAVAASPQKGRAAQMNRGAQLTGGEVLWFLHGDSIPPADALDQIAQVLGKGFEMGCFPIRFDSRHPLMAICGLLSNLRVRWRGIAFGDQGIFLRRSLFERLGGYANLPLMEDYRLSMDMKGAGLSVGMAGTRVITSDRRFRANGRLKTIGRMQALQRRFRRGDDIQAIARAYRDGGSK